MDTGQILGLFSDISQDTNTLLAVLVGFNFLWLVLLSFLVWRSYRYSKVLFGDTKHEDLKEILQEHISRVGMVQTRVNDLEKNTHQIQSKITKHVSKVGVVRFNPFDDTGGNQSFALALLDDEDDGVVISSLHGRHRTRMYAKPVKAGNYTDYEFSAEEKEAIRKAKALGHV